MPKSRFNAVREKARATRHNPVARPSNGTDKESSNGLSTSSTLAPTHQDAIPILSSLPLSDSKVEANVNTGDVLWALISLSSLLSEKATRIQLLSPGHQLVARVIYQLQNGKDIQIRDAASGFLRNLCIEAGSKARKTMEERDNVDIILKETLATAEELKLVGSPKGRSESNGSLFVPDEEEEKRRYLRELQSKPKEQLNKKERRHLAKLESAIKDSKSHAVADTAMDMAPHQSAAESKGAARDSEDNENVLLSYSHLTNLFAILWSLTEVSSQVVDCCRRNAMPLCSLVASVASRATESIDRLSHLSEETSSSIVEGRVDIGKRDKLVKDHASIQLATTALNALVTLTDSDPEFAAAFLGYSRQDLRAATKGSGKDILYDEVEEVNVSKSDGIKNIQRILTTIPAFERLESAKVDDNATRDILRVSTSIALLSAAVIRNMQNCLPAGLSNAIKVGKDSLETLGDIEMKVILPFLNKILAFATRDYTETLLSGLEIQAEKLKGDHILSHREKMADEELNISLCLEILAELVADPEGWSNQGVKGNREKDDTIEVDEDGDAEMDKDDDASSEGVVEDFTIDEEATMDMESLDAPFTKARVAQYFSLHQIDSLLALSIERKGGFANVGAVAKSLDENMASSLRSITIRALSVLNNQMLALASFALPPPSQPNQTASKNFQQWLTSTDNTAIFGKLWRRLFEYASQIASLPFINEISDLKSISQDARKVLEISLCIMWSLSRCFEGVDGGKSNEILAVEASQFVPDDFCLLSQRSYGVIASLIAAYKSSKKGTGASMLPPLDLSQSAIAAQLAPTPDGIRIHSLGILSTLVRQPFISLDSREAIVSLLVDTLEVLPTQPDVASRLKSLGLQDSTSMDAMVVAINGIIDTFADESSNWDHLYSKLKLQGRLNRCSIDVKSSSRTIDKRKQPSLRAAAEESWRNLIAFIDYRESIVSSFS